MITETATRVCPIEDCGEEAHAHAYRGIELHLSPLVFLPERLVGVRQTEDQCSEGMLLAAGEEYLQVGSREGASSCSQLISICSEASILRHIPGMWHCYQPALQPQTPWLSHLCGPGHFRGVSHL